MESKLQRESKTLLEKMFKKYDNKGLGYIDKNDMRKVAKNLVPSADDEALDELLDEYAIDGAYLVMNENSKEFEVAHQPNTIDFPSAMTIAVYFLKKEERKFSNGFAGKGLVKLTDMPSATRFADSVQNQKKLF